MRAVWLAIALLWLAGCASYPSPYEADGYAYDDGRGYNGVYDDSYYEDSYDWDSAWYRGHYGAYDVTRSYDPWFSLYWGWDYYGYPPYRPGYSRYNAYWPYYGHGWSAWDYHWWPSYGFSSWSYWNPWFGYGYWRPHYSGSDPRPHRSSRQALRELPGTGLPPSYRARPPQRSIHAGVPATPTRRYDDARYGRSRELIRGPSTAPSQRSAPASSPAAPVWSRPSPRQRDSDSAWSPRQTGGGGSSTARPASTPSSGASGRSSNWLRNDRGSASAPRSTSSSAPAPRSWSPPPSRSASSGGAPARSAPSSRSSGRSNDSARQRDDD
ncbi:MAG: hypothetical protein KDI56_01655 [Xanthomonadales bacterium]|nr:hypothetical protein [Xanthomonadales bacterium]